MDRPKNEFGKGRALWGAMLALCAVGLGVAIELTVLHVRVHLDPSYRSFCAINQTVNCDTVAQSPYSVFLGVPVSVWGILGYLAMAGVAAAALRLRGQARGIATGLMAGLTAFSVAASLVLGGISAFALGSFCLLCMVTYAINLALAVLALLEARRHGVETSLKAALRFLIGEWKRMVPVGAFGFAVVAALLAFYPAYWTAGRHAAGSADLATGVDAQGDPWIGAVNPKATIIEYSDYQCPHCRRGHEQVRALLADHPEQLRLVHRHYPLDQACNPTITSRFHPYACAYATLAFCAGEQGRFWEANDYLFEHGGEERQIDARTLAKELGLDPVKLQGCADGPAPGGLRGNVQEGIRRGVKGTPSYQLGDQVYPGRIPPEVLQRLLGG